MAVEGVVGHHGQGGGQADGQAQVVAAQERLIDVVAADNDREFSQAGLDTRSAVRWPVHGTMMGMERFRGKERLPKPGCCLSSRPGPPVPPPGYSSNLHPAESVDELIGTIGAFSQEVRRELGWPVLGLDLRLGSRAIRELAAPRSLDRLRHALDQAGCDASTINAFPPRAPFQAAVVKRAAYLPDWTTQERLDDTIAILPIAAALCSHAEVTISTVPGTYRPLNGSRSAERQVAAQLGRWAAAAARFARRHGRQMVLCLEPEPWCMLETSWDVAAFWRGPLQGEGIAAAIAALDGDQAAGRAAIEAHLAVCLDTCHVSLAFEDQAEAVARMVASGARIAKCQFSAAPEVQLPRQDAAGIAALKALAEPRFLHQTAARSLSGSLSRVEDLDQLDACLARLPLAEAVRSHFHIPIFTPQAKHGLSTTIQDSLAGLAAARAHGCLPRSASRPTPGASSPPANVMRAAARCARARVLEQPAAALPVRTAPTNATLSR